MDSKRKFEQLPLLGVPQAGEARSTSPLEDLSKLPPPAQEFTTLKIIWSWFLSRECPNPNCKRIKIPKQCFCQRCYYALPQNKRSGLYVSALEGDEFYFNYFKAVLHLIGEGVKG
jgi:hypothetical protein